MTEAEVKATSDDFGVYEVEIGYGEIGEDENFPLGKWTGYALSKIDAEKQAMGALWDDRLDVCCGPRILVRKLESLAAIG